MVSPRNLLITLLAIPFVSIAHRDAAAQATVVQLPTFHTFGVNTSVLVPDRGATYLGGVNYSSAGNTSRGIPGLGGRPFTNRSFGRSTGGGNVWVTAHIHDFEAMEARLMAEAGGVQGLGGQTHSHAAAGGGQYAATPSVAAIRAKLAREDSAQQREALDYLRRAKEKLDEGKPGLAKIYFQMAQRRASGEVKEQAIAGLREIDEASRR